MALSVGSRENRSFRARLAAEERRSPVLVGLEHEFSLRRAQEPVDFEALLPGLPAPGVRLDPGDPNAHRCSWGGVITADAMEAEIACPPVEAAPGFTTRLTRWAVTGASYLSGVLPDDVETFGYSTHLSVSVPARSVVRASDIYSRTFAPAVMLMLDGPLSPGLRVRSRPGRVELCGEYARGDRLRAAATFALGSVRASAHAARTLHSKRGLPPAVRAERIRTYERPGWFLARTSFGADLYRYCRTTRLNRVGGGTISAQDHLELSWSSARRELEGLATTDELRLVDDVVGGALPLGPEGELPSGRQYASDQMRSVFADAIRPRHRPRFEVKVIAATWDWHLFRVTGERNVYACIPRNALEAFLEQLDAGDLDEALLRYMGGPDRGRVLSHPRQTLRAGLYDRIGSLQGLLRSEIGGLAWGRAAKGRAGKRNRPVVFPRTRRWPGRIGATHPGSGREGDRDRRRRVRILRWSITRSTLLIAGLATAGVLGTGGYLLASGGSSPDAAPGTEEPRTESSPSAAASPSAAPSPQIVFQVPWDRLSEALRLTEQPLISDDAADDAIESARGREPTFFTSEADIADFSGITATLDARALKDLFGDLPACGRSREDVATVCSSDEPFNPGRYVIVAGTMRSPVSLDSPNFAVYAAVFDSNGRTGDNFEPDPAFPNDFYQGTDHWIQLVRSPQAGLNVSVMEPEAPTGDFHARAIIWRESVIFIERLSEFDIELPSFRMTAFINKGDFTPDSKRGGDVAPGLPGPWELEPLQVAAQAEAPEPEEPPEPTMETVRQFVKVFNEAREEQNVDFLFARLHPEVIELYSRMKCRRHLNESVTNPLRIEVKGVGDPEPWPWEVDGRSTRIPDVYPVDARIVIADGPYATVSHFARTGNHLSWFTDCGTPR